MSLKRWTQRDAMDLAGAEIRVGNPWRDRVHEIQKVFGRNKEVIILTRKLGARGYCWKLSGDVPANTHVAFTENLSHGEALYYAISWLLNQRKVTDA